MLGNVEFYGTYTRNLEAVCCTMNLVMLKFSISRFEGCVNSEILARIKWYRIIAKTFIVNPNIVYQSLYILNAQKKKKRKGLAVTCWAMNLKLQC